MTETVARPENRRISAATESRRADVMPGQAHRIDGGLIDRTQPLQFTFNGRSYTGYSGDTLASALLANGQRLVGRSFKYHRPRGIFSAGSEEPNALVELRKGAHKGPNTRATVAELYDVVVLPEVRRPMLLGFKTDEIRRTLSIGEAEVI